MCDWYHKENYTYPICIKIKKHTQEDPSPEGQRIVPMNTPKVSW